MYVKEKPSDEEVQMNTFSGNGRFGLPAVFAVLLMPLLGMSSADALDVGDQVTIPVPELSAIVTMGPTEHEFTCRAVSEHAYWLVQNAICITSSGELVYPPSSSPDSLCWGNIIDQDELDAMVAAFEGGEADVWNTVTSVYGTPVDVDGDPKVWIVLATIPTKYQPTSPGSGPTPRNNMYYVDSSQYSPEAVDPHDMFYVNIGTLIWASSQLNIARQLRLWNLPVGLAAMSSWSQHPDQEPWLIKGMSEVAQNLCFGFTSSSPGGRGQKALVGEYAGSPFLDLRNPTAGNELYDYIEARATGFMWFMYLTQRFGNSIITGINASDFVGMEAVANAIDPSVAIEEAVAQNVVPVYMNWITAASANYIHSDLDGGIYQYDFLMGTPMEAMTVIGKPGLSNKFSEYPIEGWIAQPPSDPGAPKLPYGMIFMESSEFASQFITFEDPGQAMVYFNGMYSDGSGANAAINGAWDATILQIENDQISSIATITLDDFYNGSFEIGGDMTVLAVTNNNPDGAGGLRYYISQREEAPELMAAAHPNALNSQFTNVYCTLQKNSTNELTGFDWIGPIFEVILGDSVQNIKMVPLYGSLYNGLFTAWAAGNYEISISGYDSVGHMTETSLNLAAGYAETDLKMDLGYVSLQVPDGGAPSGTMVVLAETGTLGLAVESGTTVPVAGERMTGIVAGPVSVSNVNGVISFDSQTNDVAIYRYTDEAWVELDSWRQNGMVHASIETGGIYALGEGIGAFAPELPAQLELSGNYPNPFSAETALNFALPSAGNVRITVFDMSGRCVATLTDEEMAAANHSVIWNGTDHNGDVVGAGVYFCRLEADGQVITQKMLKVQ